MTANDPTRDAHSPAWSNAVFFAVEFAILLGLWMLYAGAAKLDELVAGIFAAALAAAASAVVRKQNLAHFYAHLDWITQGLRLPWYILTGTWEITKVLLLQVLGRKPAPSLLLAVPFEMGRKDDEEAAARRALAVALTTITPNFVVIDFDPVHRLMLYHQVKKGRVLKMTQALGARP